MLGVPFLHCVLAVQDVSLLLPATMPVTCCHVLPIVTESDSLGPQALVRAFYHSEIKVTNIRDEPLLSASQEQNLTVKGWEDDLGDRLLGTQYYPQSPGL